LLPPFLARCERTTDRLVAMGEPSRPADRG
jgi:hypothetical protein